MVDQRKGNYDAAESLSPVSSDNSFEEKYQIRGLANIDVQGLGLATVSHAGQFFWARRNLDIDTVATQPSVYDIKDKKDQFWPRADYENLHRFDVNLRWSWREELKVIRKIDFRILIWTCVMFWALEMDRASIGQALSDNLLKDLKITTDDYNNGMTIFFCSFLFAELPSQLIAKKIGPDWWMPTQITLWSIVAICQFFMINKTTFYICRCLLGLFHGGFIPDAVLYLSYFYTSKELPIRCSIFFTSMIIADISSAFISFGVLHLRGHFTTVLSNGAHLASGWRWLFLIEGLIGMSIGLLSFLLLPSAPTTTASWFRGKKGWFTAREESIMITRILRDDPTKGTMHNRQGIKPKHVWSSIKEFDLWPIYLVGVSYSLPVTPVKNYLTLTLKGLGFSTFKTNLLVIPGNVIQLIGLIVGTYVSELIQSRTLVAMFPQVWLLPLQIALNTFGAHTNKWSKYTVSILIVGYMYPHAIQVAWCSRNSNTVRTRTISASLYQISVQISSILASQMYRASDAPLYKKGNRAMLIVNIINIFLYTFVFFYYRSRNQARDKKWNAMTPEEQNNYIENTTDEGSKRLDFRFAY